MIAFAKRNLEKLLGIRDTPERIAAAFSLGVFLAFCPLLGLHTLLGLGLAFVLRLSRLAVLAGVYTNTPWTLIPYYTFATWFGSLFCGSRQFLHPGLFRIRLADVLTARFLEFLMESWGVLIPFFLGSTILAILLAIASYPVSLAILRSRHGISEDTQK
jgi:uncharacterized protein